MSSFVTRLRRAAERRARYAQIYHELRMMPRATAIDLGMFPEDARRVAYEAVYGPKG